MADNIKFYMQKDGEGAISIEDHFQGVKYSKCTGLYDKGARTNMFIEQYADSDEIRVWQDENVAREATDITITIYFVGDSRHLSYEAFYEYIKNGKIRFWDTERMKEAYLVFDGKLSVKEDVYKGSIPYKLADFKFKNIWGECKDKTI